MFKDFEGKYDLLIEALTKNIDVEKQEVAKDYLGKVFSQMESFVLAKHPKEVWDVILFQQEDSALSSLEDVTRIFDLESETEKAALLKIRSVIASANKYLKNCFNSEKTISLNGDQKVTFCDCGNEDMQSLSKLMQLAVAESTLKMFDCKTLIIAKSAPNIIVNVGKNAFKENKESYLIESGIFELPGAWKTVFEGSSAPFPKALAKTYGGFETIEIR